MTARDVDFLESWIASNVTESVKDGGHVTPLHLSIELAERAVADVVKAGLSITDLAPEFGTPETIIREALESSEVSLGD